MKNLRIFIVVLSLFIGFELSAQPPDPGGGTEPKPNCFPPPCVPIDGGLSWLLLAGTVYGGKKVLDLNKEEKEKID